MLIPRQRPLAQSHLIFIHTASIKPTNPYAVLETSYLEDIRFPSTVLEHSVTWNLRTAFALFLIHLTPLCDDLTELQRP